MTFRWKSLFGKMYLCHTRAGKYPYAINVRASLQPSFKPEPVVALRRWDLGARESGGGGLRLHRLLGGRRGVRPPRHVRAEYPFKNYCLSGEQLAYKDMEDIPHMVRTALKQSVFIDRRAKNTDQSPFGVCAFRRVLSRCAGRDNYHISNASPP